jgi:hypothetical protein
MRNFNCLRRRNAKARVRLARMQAFTDIIERLAGFHGGKAFMVDTTHLKDQPPALHVTERLSTVRLLYVRNVAAMASVYARPLRIEIINEQMTYIIN